MTAVLEEAADLVGEDIDQDWLIEWSMAKAGPRLYGNGIMSMKYDSENEHCDCADFAVWPGEQPYVHRNLSSTFIVEVYDELGRLIGIESLELE